MDDAELIRAARNNEPHAGPFLVSMYGSRLAGYCRSIAADLSDTDRERIVETAIETAVRRIDKFDARRGPLSAWLRPFVLHATQDWRRAHARFARYDLDDIPVEAGAFGEPQSARAAALADAVHDALPQLRIPDQIIIVLRTYEQRSVSETASILGLSEVACRQRHHRALRRLGAILESDERVHRFIGEMR